MRRLFHPEALPRCPVCGLHLRLCPCEGLPVLETRARLGFLQHPDERRKSTNTVRLARRVCPGLGLWDWPGRTGELRLPADALLLFPADGAPELEPGDLGQATVVLLDGTWSQASRMYRVLEGRGLPARRLPEGLLSSWQARRSDDPGRFSSAHAAALALELGGERLAAAALREAVDRVGEGFARMRGLRPGAGEEKTVMEESAIGNPESRFPDRS